MKTRLARAYNRSLVYMLSSFVGAFATFMYVWAMITGTLGLIIGVLMGLGMVVVFFLGPLPRQAANSRSDSAPADSV